MQLSSVLLVVAVVVGVASADQTIISSPLGAKVIPSSPDAPTLPAGLTDLAPTQLLVAVNAISALAVATQSTLLLAVAKGVVVNSGGLYPNITVGAITLPPGYLCSDSAGAVTALTALTSCYVCSADCTWVHNKYGGLCGIQTNPAINSNQDSFVCTCGDTMAADGNVLTPLQQCGPIVQGSDLVNNVIGLLLQYALVARENAQCVPQLSTSGQLIGFNSASCTNDCTTNHQYYCGICDQEIPIQTKAGQAPATSTSNYCGCYYGDISTDGTIQCTSTPKIYSS